MRMADAHATHGFDVREDNLPRILQLKDGFLCGILSRTGYLR